MWFILASEQSFTYIGVTGMRARKRPTWNEMQESCFPPAAAHCGANRETDERLPWMCPSLLSSRWSVTSTGPAEARKPTGWSRWHCWTLWSWPHIVSEPLHFTRFAFDVFTSFSHFPIVKKDSFEKSRIWRLFISWFPWQQWRVK